MALPALLVRGRMNGLRGLLAFEPRPGPCCFLWRKMSTAEEEQTSPVKGACTGTACFSALAERQWHWWVCAVGYLFPHVEHQGQIELWRLMPELRTFLWFLKVLSAKRPRAALAGKLFFPYLPETQPGSIVFIFPIPLFLRSGNFGLKILIILESPVAVF